MSVDGVGAGWESTLLVAATASTPFASGGFELVTSSRGRAVYCEKSMGVIARLSAPGHRRRAENEVAFASWSAVSGLPVDGPDRRVPGQPIVTADGSASFWPLRTPLTPGQVDVMQFGAMLRRLHQAEPPLFEPWNPRDSISKAVTALGRASTVDPEVVEMLAARAGRALADAAEIASGLPSVAIHGDAFPDNAVLGPRGLLLIDFENAGLGPAIFDLAPLHVLSRRFGWRPDAFDELVTGYGTRPDSRALEVMVDLTEIAVTCGAIAPYAATEPLFHAELARRVRSLGRPGTWTPHRRLLAQLSQPPSAQVW